MRVMWKLGEELSETHITRDGRKTLCGILFLPFHLGGVITLVRGKPGPYRRICPICYRMASAGEKRRWMERNGRSCDATLDTQNERQESVKHTDNHNPDYRDHHGDLHCDDPDEIRDFHG